MAMASVYVYIICCLLQPQLLPQNVPCDSVGCSEYEKPTRQIAVPWLCVNESALLSTFNIAFDYSQPPPEAACTNSNEASWNLSDLETLITLIKLTMQRRRKRGAVRININFFCIFPSLYGWMAWLKMLEVIKFSHIILFLLYSETLSLFFRVVLVENIPEDISFMDNVTSHVPLSEGLYNLLDQAIRVVEIVSPLWLLNSSDYEASFQPAARQVTTQSQKTPWTKYVPCILLYIPFVDLCLSELVSGPPLQKKREILRFLKQI